MNSAFYRPTAVFIESLGVAWKGMLLALACLLCAACGASESGEEQQARAEPEWFAKDVRSTVYEPPQEGDLLGRYLMHLTGPSPSESKRFALDQIRRIGPEAAPRILEQIEHYLRQSSRFAALHNLIEALGASGAREHAGILVRILRESPTPVVRTAAVQQIRGFGAVELVPDLIRHISGPENERSVYKEIVVTVATLGGEGAGDFLELQLQRWLKGDPKLVLEANTIWTSLLAFDDGKTIDRLKRLEPVLPSGPHRVQAIATRTELGETGLEEELRSFLDPGQYPGAAVRSVAVLALGLAHDWEAVFGAATDAASQVRMSVIKALRHEDAREEEVGIDMLQKLAYDPDPSVVGAALFALVERGHLEALEPWLGLAAEYPEATGSLESIQLLKDEGAYHPKTTDILISRWPHCELEQRITLLRALAHIGDPQGLDFFRGVFRDEQLEPDLHLLAAHLLPNFGEGSIEAMLEVWQSDPPVLVGRSLILGFAEQVENPRARDLLLDLCADPETQDGYRQQVFEILPKALGEEAFAPLLAARDASRRREVRQTLNATLATYF